MKYSCLNAKTPDDCILNDACNIPRHTQNNPVGHPPPPSRILSYHFYDKMHRTAPRHTTSPPHHTRLTKIHSQNIIIFL